MLSCIHHRFVSFSCVTNLLLSELLEVKFSSLKETFGDGE